MSERRSQRPRSITPTRFALRVTAIRGCQQDLPSLKEFQSDSKCLRYFGSVSLESGLVDRFSLKISLPPLPNILRLTTERSSL